MGIILFLVAIFLGVILIPLGVGWDLLKYISRYFYRFAYAIDQLGNVACAELFNDTLIKKDGHKFGNPDESISAVLGINKLNGKLTKMGRALADFLNFIDKNHVEKAAKKP